MTLRSDALEILDSLTVVAQICMDEGVSILNAIPEALAAAIEAGKENTINTLIRDLDIVEAGSKKLRSAMEKHEHYTELIRSAPYTAWRPVSATLTDLIEETKTDWDGTNAREYFIWVGGFGQVSRITAMLDDYASSIYKELWV